MDMLEMVTGAACNQYRNASTTIWTLGAVV